MSVDASTYRWSVVPDANGATHTYESIAGTVDATVMRAWVSYPAHEARLLRALADAAIYYDDHGGLGGDRVREIARQIKALRQQH